MTKRAQRVKISNRYRQKAAEYAKFADQWKSILDFSDKALEECFLWESNGKPLSNPALNGYAIGKGWLDVNIAMWKEDIAKGLLQAWELEEYEKFLK